MYGSTAARSAGFTCVTPAPDRENFDAEPWPGIRG